MAEVAPAGTVIDVGGDAKELSDDKATVRPPLGAAMLSVIVPVTDVPPTTELGETVMEPGTGIFR